MLIHVPLELRQERTHRVYPRYRAWSVLQILPPGFRFHRKHIRNDGRTMSFESFPTFPRGRRRHYWIACSRFHRRFRDYFAAFSVFLSDDSGDDTTRGISRNSAARAASITRRIKWAKYFRQASRAILREHAILSHVQFVIQRCFS